MDQSATKRFGRTPDERGRALTGRLIDGAGGYAARTRQSLHHLMTNELPADVRDEEFSVSICFRSSLVLNALTGGDPEMTFSARCHLHHHRAPWVGPWLLWGIACLAIDLACAALRGESEHCATAWQNHCARGQGEAAVDESRGLSTPVSAQLTEI